MKHPEKSHSWQEPLEIKVRKEKNNKGMARSSMRWSRLLTIWLPLVTPLSMDGEKRSPENKTKPSLSPSSLLGQLFLISSTLYANCVTSITPASFDVFCSPTRYASLKWMIGSWLILLRSDYRLVVVGVKQRQSRRQSAKVQSALAIYWALLTSRQNEWIRSFAVISCEVSSPAGDPITGCFHGR